MRRAEPAALAWAVLIGEALAVDVVLIRRGRRTLSNVAGCPVGWVLHALLAAHFAHLLGPADPFHAAARWLTRETT